MIEVRDIYKRFDGQEVLKGISLHVASGQVVSIMGSSGAGKSTLLSIIGTLENPDSGSVHIDGTDVSTLRDRALADFRNRYIGFVFQFHYLIPELTATENVCLPAMIAGERKSQCEKRAREILDFLGLSHRQNAYPSTLSGGEQQRVAFARALINRPKVVLADEPTGNLDTENATLLHNMIRDLRNEFGQTFVVVTHNPSLAAVSDVTFTMKDGRILHHEG